MHLFIFLYQLILLIDAASVTVGPNVPVGMANHPLRNAWARGCGVGCCLCLWFPILGSPSGTLVCCIGWRPLVPIPAQDALRYLQHIHCFSKYHYFFCPQLLTLLYRLRRNYDLRSIKYYWSWKSYCSLLWLPLLLFLVLSRRPSCPSWVFHCSWLASLVLWECGIHQEATISSQKIRSITNNLFLASLRD